MSVFRACVIFWLVLLLFIRWAVGSCAAAFFGAGSLGAVVVLLFIFGAVSLGQSSRDASYWFWF